MSSIFTKQVTFSVEGSDFEYFIAEHYSIPAFEILESDRDVIHKFQVVNQPLNKQQRDRLLVVLEKGHGSYREMGTVLQDLCHQNKVEAGEYYMQMY